MYIIIMIIIYFAETKTPYIILCKRYAAAAAERVWVYLCMCVCVRILCYASMNLVNVELLPKCFYIQFSIRF